MSARKLSSASQIPNPPSTDPAVNSWAQNSPVGQWPANVPAQYAVTFFNAAGETAFGPWGSMSGAGSALADLEEVPLDPSGQATGRNIYRQLQGFNVQLVGTINDNTTTVFQDTDTSVPLSPPTTAPDLPSQSWAQNTPIGQWPVGVQASYAVSFLNGSYETALGPWVPFSGGGYWALALLTDIPTDPTGQASGRNIYRQLEGFDPQLIGTIGDNTTTEFQDNSTTVPQRTLNIDSRLIEDYLHTDDILVDQSQPQPVAVFLNSEQETEALVINKAGELCHIYREPLSDSGWNIYGLGASLSSIAVVNSGTFWAIGACDGSLWQNNIGRWMQAPGLPGGAIAASVSAGPDGNVWAIGFGGALYQYSQSGGEWQVVDGVPSLSSCPVGVASSLWAVDSSDLNIVSNASGSWQTIGMLPNGDMPSQLAAGSDGSVWACGNSGNLYQYVNSQWQQMQGVSKLGGIAAVNANNLWGIVVSGVTASLMQYANGTWQQVQEAPTLQLSSVPALAAGADGTVWCLNAGQAWKYMGAGLAWQYAMMPTGMHGFTANRGITEVAAGQDPQKTQHAFLVQNGELFHSAYSSLTGWGKPEDIGVAGSWVGVTNQQDTGDLIMYAAASDGSLIVSTLADGQLSTQSVYVNGSLKGVKLQLSATSAEAWFIAGVVGPYLSVNWGTAANPMGTGIYAGIMWPVTPWVDNQPVGDPPTPPTMQGIIRLPWVQSENTFYTATVDGSGNIYVVFNIVWTGVNEFGLSGAYGSYNQLSGTSGSALSSAYATAAVIDSTGMARLYASDANNVLWVIRQTGGTEQDDDNPWTWTSWHPLGDNCTYLVTGPGGLGTSEFYTLDDNYFLNVLQQNSISLDWVATQVLMPTDVTVAPDYVAQYVTHLTVLDSNGNPASGVTINVSVVEPVSIWVAGTQYNLDSSTGLSLTSSFMGQIAVSSLALGLHTAQLTFSGTSLDQSYPVYPPQLAQNTLSSLTLTDLQSAQAQTQGGFPVPPSQPLLSDPNSPNVPTALTVIQDTFTLKANANITPTTVGTTLTRSSRRALRQRPTGDLGSGLGSWWSDLEDFPEDVYHGIQTGILKVQGVVVDETIQITLALEGLGQQVLSFTIETIHDVVNALHTAFAWVGAEVDKVVDWLKELFDWPDIVNTHTVVEYYVNQLLANLQNNLDPNSSQYVYSLIQTQFQNLIGQVNTAFANAEATFGQNASFNDNVQSVQVNPAVGNSALDGSGLKSSYGSNQSKCNYVHAKTNTYIAQGGTFGSSGGGGVTRMLGDPLGDFMVVVEQVLNPSNPANPFAQTLSQMQCQLQANLKNPNGLFDMAVCGFLDIVQDFVQLALELVEDLILALLPFAGQAFDDLNTLLNYPINIPVMSWLYRQIAQHPLTILDLACMVLAVPTTILYKLMFSAGAAPFTSAQVGSITSQSIPWPQIDGSSVGQALGSSRHRQLGTSPVMGELYLFSYFSYGFIDFFSDLDAAAKQNLVAVPPPPGTSPPEPAPDPGATFLSIAGIVLSAFTQIWSTPTTVLSTSPDDWTEADWLYLSTWGMGFAAWAWTVGFTMLSSVKQSPIFDEVGPLVTGALGGCAFGLGVATAIAEAGDSANYPAIYQAQAIVSPIPTLLKSLILTKNEVAQGLLLGTDAVCDTATAVLGFLEDV